MFVISGFDLFTTIIINILLIFIIIIIIYTGYDSRAKHQLHYSSL